MAKAVLDASTVLAYLKAESGADVAADWMANAAISAVNLSEVVAKLIDLGDDARTAIERVAMLPVSIAGFEREAALRAGALREQTRSHGLSLGDRACLAFADIEGLPVVTTDRAWSALDLGVEVVLIR